MRVGVAVSDLDRVVARPLEVIAAQDLLPYLRTLVREEGISEVVVGIPKTLRGELGPQARVVLDTIKDLRREFPGVRFVEWDERLTTRIAVTGRRREKKRGKAKRVPARVDHLAAAQMLQEYLGAREGG